MLALAVLAFDRRRGGHEEIRQADPVQHFLANVIHHPEGQLRAVVRRIDVDAKRPLTERQVDHLRDRVGHGPGVGGRRHDGAEGFLHLRREAGVRPSAYSAARAASAGEPACAK